MISFHDKAPRKKKVDLLTSFGDGASVDFRSFNLCLKLLGIESSPMQYSSVTD